MRNFVEPPHFTGPDWYDDDGIPTCTSCECDLEEYNWLDKQFRYCPECGEKLISLDEYEDYLEGLKEQAEDNKLMEALGK